MAKWDLNKLHHENNTKGNNSPFDLSHHGDEVICYTKDDRIRVAVKIQTGFNESKSTLLTFETQTQMERLFPAIMKGLSR
jgi:hypothetical protein